jgi:hypothetical protein
VQLVRDLRKRAAACCRLGARRAGRRYGAFVHLVEDGEEPKGVVCDVSLATVADDGASAAIVATCGAADSRVAVGRAAKSFPYTAAECRPLRDAAEDLEEDPLAAYDVVDEDLSARAARQWFLDGRLEAAHRFRSVQP